MFQIGQDKVIKCWEKGALMLALGQKAKLVCPAELAYGDHGNSPDIGPGETLEFEVEVVKHEAKID